MTNPTMNKMAPNMNRLSLIALQRLLISNTGHARGVEPYNISFSYVIGPEVMSFKDLSSDY
jgi:hypothetical protein